MWPFSQQEDKSTVAETPNSDPREEEEEIIEVEETRIEEYTEHTGTATFIDGSEREFVFDAMREDDGKIILKNYAGAFVTIPHDNLKTFETTKRETKEMEYTVTVEKLKSEMEEEE